MAGEIGRAALDAFQRQLEGSTGWPPPGESKLRSALEVFQALRESDRDVLQRVMQFDPARRLVVDPLGERIPGAFADLIYGEPPTIIAANEADQPHLDGLVEANALPDELLGAVSTASSEGEAWWRIIADRSVGYPTIEWHSRLAVIPSYSGSQLRAVAFVERLERPAFDDDDKSVWRYVEIQARGLSRNLLYRSEGLEKGIGKPRNLSEHYFTEDLEPEWNHGLDLILAGRIRNRVGRGRSAIAGLSDFHGVRDLLLELNEAASIGSENMKLTAKKRVVLTPDYLDSKGEFPAGVDVILASKTDDDPDRPDKGLVQLEWSFDAAPLVEWIEYLTDTALTRARVAPQLVGRATESAQTGPAFRARLLDSLLAAGGKARAWDAGVPQMLLAAQLVDALPEESGGFGHSWTASQEPPTVERASALPVDEDEQASRLATERSAEIISRRSAIKERHPDWTDEQLDAELKLIDADAPAGPAPFEPFAPQE